MHLSTKSLNGLGCRNIGHKRSHCGARSEKEKHDIKLFPGNKPLELTLFILKDTPSLFRKDGIDLSYL